MKLRMLKLGRNRFDQPPADSLNIILHTSIIEQRELTLGLLCGLAPKLDVLGFAVWIAGRNNPRLSQNRYRRRSQR